MPTDERVLEIIQDNRRLELMTMGDFTDSLTEEAADESETMEVVDAC